MFCFLDFDNLLRIFFGSFKDSCELTGEFPMYFLAIFSGVWKIIKPFRIFSGIFQRFIEFFPIILDLIFPNCLDNRIFGYLLP
jgi:hypothetical protein